MIATKSVISLFLYLTSKHNTMMTKPTLWAVLCVVALAGVFSGCQSSKIAYGNSYYFKQTPKPVAKAASSVDRVAPLSSELQVSAEPEAVAQRDAKSLVERAQQQLLAVAEKSNNTQLKEQAQRMNRMANEMKGQELTKKEARAKRKELRKELRSLAKEYKAMAPNETNDLDQNLKVSLILLGASLLFFILGAFIPYIGIVGLLALLAALVFFIIWLATEA